MEHEHGSPRERKKALLKKKNRLHQQIFTLLRLRRSEEDRVRDLEKSQKPKSQEKNAPDAKTTDKVNAVRNRLTGQKRLSRERWNRFAGTSGGGGRGL